MRIHRFYVGQELELKHDFWLHDERLVYQWRKVLRMQPGQELVLFDGVRSDRLYKLVELNDREAHLQFVTDFERKLPTRDVYLCWSLIKKDKNDWVLQKGTELGVTHFVPLIAERSEKLGFDVDRAEKIVIEAAEQCGRSDIPVIREPLSPETLLHELGSTVEFYICEQGSDTAGSGVGVDAAVGVLVGPEGGWSEREKSLFTEQGIRHIALGSLTLRAETAAVIAASVLAQQ